MTHKQSELEPPGIARPKLRWSRIVVAVGGLGIVLCELALFADVLIPPSRPPSIRFSIAPRSPTKAAKRTIRSTGAAPRTVDSWAAGLLCMLRSVARAAGCLARAMAGRPPDRRGPPLGPPGQPGGFGPGGPPPDGPRPMDGPAADAGDYHFVDVHGAGAQRSDPKAGDPAQFPHGRGPQGDVIRINNFVRCVRNTLK